MVFWIPYCSSPYDYDKYCVGSRWNVIWRLGCGDSLICRNNQNGLIVTISQNSIGSAITEMLGVVVGRPRDVEAYGRAEPVRPPGSPAAGDRPLRESMEFAGLCIKMALCAVPPGLR